MSGRDAVVQNDITYVQRLNMNMSNNNNTSINDKGTNTKIDKTNKNATNTTKINAVMVVPEFEDITEDTAPVEIYNLGKRGRPHNSESTSMAENNTNKDIRRNRTTPPEHLDGPSFSSIRDTQTQLPGIQNILNRNSSADNIEMASHRAISGKQLKIKRLRAPPRKIPITNDKVDSDIWSKLEATRIEVPLKEWIITNKQAQRDLRDGTRFLLGRKVVTTNKNKRTRREKGKEKETINNTSQPMVINKITNAVNDATIEYEEIYDESDAYTSSASYVESDMEEIVGETDLDTDFYSEDDDTDYEYPYDLNIMKRSTPLRAPITIYDHKLEAIFDSGASVSLISRALAKRLRLLPNGDTIPIASVDDKRNNNSRNDPRRRSDITLSVPIRVAGKLRPEHMVINDDCDDDTCILGMTWFKQYDVTQKLKESMIIVPTKGGKSRVLLQGKSTLVKPNKQARVYTISIREIDSDGHLTNNNPNNDNTDLNKLLMYDEEIIGEKDMHETKPIDTNTLSPGGDNNEIIPVEIKSLLEKFANSFAENGGLGKVSIEHEHTIELKDPNEIIKTKPYRLTWEEDAHLKEELDQLLEKGLIRPSKGRWTSPVFFVQKKDKGLRLVVDFRKLNKNTKKMVYPLPHINELLDSLGGAMIFSTLDAASGYWQVPLNEDSIEKTGFITKYGTYEFLVMPFGLCTASDTYQKMMSSLMAPYIGRFVFVFIDDIIVYSKDINEHLTHLKTVFEVCNAANLRLKRSKCHFACKSVEYLGHVVSADGVLPTTHNVSKLINMKTPECVSEVRSLLGTTNYYRRYIPNYAALMRPITRLLKKAETFIWETEQEDAFTLVKEVLTNPPILSYPDRDQTQILTTDGCSTGIGAILSQSPDGSNKQETVIAYASKALKDSERNLSTTEIEAYAIIWAVKYFRHYLAGKNRKFILYTDHSALAFILNNEKPTPKISRWAAALMEHNYEVRYKPGKNNPADALSRLIVGVKG